MDVPIEYCLVDERRPADLKTMTVSNYRRQDVLKDFAKSLQESNLERAMAWVAELHCSGKAELIWQELLESAPEYIGTANPHLLSWLVARKAKYDQLLAQFVPKYRHEHRNNQEMRNLLTDTVAVVALSHKAPIQLPPISKKDLEPARVKEKMISRSLRFCQGLLHEMDPNEIKLPVNEIANHLQLINFSVTDAIYWYLWLEQMDSTKKKYDGFICIPQPPHLIQDSKWHADWVWPVWRAVLKEAEHRPPSVRHQITTALEIYCAKFSASSKKKRRVLLFYAIGLLSDAVKWKTPIIHNVAARIRACAGNNLIYKRLDEMLDPYRTTGRTEYFAFVSPLVSKEKPKRKEKEVVAKKEKKKQDKFQAFADILNVPIPASIASPPPSDPESDTSNDDEDEVRVVTFGA